MPEPLDVMSVEDFLTFLGLRSFFSDDEVARKIDASFSTASAWQRAELRRLVGKRVAGGLIVDPIRAALRRMDGLSD